jgi:cell division septation protein DedD
MFMPLYARTPRRTLDHYDPKQRLVGGIVLCLIILLIYFILKILIGLSAVHDGRYKLASAKEDEVLKSTAAAMEPTTHRVVGNDGVNTITTLPKPLRPLPLNFTFLDLDGNPMNKEALAIEEEQVANAKTKATDAGWVVQAGIFKTEGSAKQRVDKLKEKGFESVISKVGNRFVVNLIPMQPDKAAAQKLSKQVTTQAGLKYLKIRENKPPQPPQSP